jgi:hypothetical protein
MKYFLSPTFPSHPYNDETSEIYYVAAEEVNTTAVPVVNLTCPNRTQLNQMEGNVN